MLETKLEAKMDTSPYNSNVIFAKELEDELMKFTAKCDDYKADENLGEQTREVHGNADVEVNITECTKSPVNKPIAAEYQDTTESSSSFDEDDSGVENFDAFGESEALSNFHSDASSGQDLDGFGEKFRMRKRKLTTHWRSYIQPLMWRCKWAELQIKKFQLQSQLYDRELDEYNKRKQIQIEDSALIDGVKSVPFSRLNDRSDIIKRKKRRATEATVDVAAYMSSHNLFSYYENKKAFTEGAIVCNESKNPAIQKVNITDDFFGDSDELLSFEPKNGDTSLDHVLWKIEFLQSRVGKLKSRVGRVAHENAGDFFYDNDLSLPMPCIASPPNSAERMAIGSYVAPQLIPDYNMADVFVPESAVTSHGDDVPQTSGSTHHACFADAYKTVQDGVLIDNQKVKEEMNNLEEVMIHPIQMLNDGLGSSAAPVIAGPNPPTEDQTPPNVPSIAKLSTPKGGKRKRGRRKGPIRRTRRIQG